jgi:transcriptional regulator with PAS, ATPase and Fis domain
VGGSKPIKTNFRLVVATNVDLQRAVQEGRFRQDLYYRINVIPVTIPPLRDRAADIPHLIDFFLRRYTCRFRKRVVGITESVMAALTTYRWPGNTRELEHVIERMVAVTNEEYISEADLPREVLMASLHQRSKRTGSRLAHATNVFERTFLLTALETNDWNVTGTAEYLGMPLSTLKYKMDRLAVRQLGRRLGRTS